MICTTTILIYLDFRRLHMRTIIVLAVILLLGVSAACAAEAEDLLDWLEDQPGLNVLKISDTAYLVVIDSEGVSAAEQEEDIDDSVVSGELLRMWEEPHSWRSTSKILLLLHLGWIRRPYLYGRFLSCQNL